MEEKDILNYSNYIYGLMKYFRNYANKDDLYQAGWVGLTTASEKYDPALGAKFTTYAFSFIIGEMHKLVREDRGIKVSVGLNKLSLEIEKTKILLSQQLNRYPSIKEIAFYLNRSEEEITECVIATNPVMSTDYVVCDDGKQVVLADIIGDKSTDYDTLIAIKQVLDNLNPKEKFILESYINNYTQEEIANYLGINQVQVSRQLSKTKEKIRQMAA